MGHHNAIPFFPQLSTPIRKTAIHCSTSHNRPMLSKHTVPALKRSFSRANSMPLGKISIGHLFRDGVTSFLVPSSEGRT